MRSGGEKLHHRRVAVQFDQKILVAGGEPAKPQSRRLDVGRHALILSRLGHPRGRIFSYPRGLAG
jgi:hypothetical protein